MPTVPTNAPSPTSTTSSEAYEPNDEWKLQLWKRIIEVGFQSMVEDAKENQAAEMKKLPDTPETRLRIEANCKEAMQTIKRLATKQYWLELDRERNRRSWTAGVVTDPDWTQHLIEEQRNIMRSIGQGRNRADKWDSSRGKSSKSIHSTDRPYLSRSPLSPPTEIRKPAISPVPPVKIGSHGNSASMRSTGSGTSVRPTGPTTSIRPLIMVIIPEQADDRPPGEPTVEENNHERTAEQRRRLGSSNVRSASSSKMHNAISPIPNGPLSAKPLMTCVNDDRRYPSDGERDRDGEGDMHPEQRRGSGPALQDNIHMNEFYNDRLEGAGPSRGRRRYNSRSLLPDDLEWQRPLDSALPVPSSQIRPWDDLDMKLRQEADKFRKEVDTKKAEEVVQTDEAGKEEAREGEEPKLMTEHHKGPQTAECRKKEEDIWSTPEERKPKPNGSAGNDNVWSSSSHLPASPGTSPGISRTPPQFNGTPVPKRRTNAPIWGARPAPARGPLIKLTPPSSIANRSPNSTPAGEPRTDSVNSETYPTSSSLHTASLSEAERTHKKREFTKESKEEQSRRTQERLKAERQFTSAGRGLSLEELQRKEDESNNNINNLLMPQRENDPERAKHVQLEAQTIVEDALKTQEKLKKMAEARKNGMGIKEREDILRRREEELRCREEAKRTEEDAKREDAKRKNRYATSSDCRETELSHRGGDCTAADDNSKDELETKRIRDHAAEMRKLEEDKREAKDELNRIKIEPLRLIDKAARQDEEKRKEEEKKEEASRREEETCRKEEEVKRKEEEVAKKEEEAKRIWEEAKKKEEAVNRKEDEARRKAEELSRREEGIMQREAQLERDIEIAKQMQLEAQRITEDALKKQDDLEKMEDLMRQEDTLRREKEAEKEEATSREEAAKDSGNTVVIGGAFNITEGSGKSPADKGIAKLFLKVASGAFHDSGELSDPLIMQCHPNTRAAIIQGILDWLDDLESPELVMWLHGATGAGKSAIAQTIAQLLSEQKQLSGSFFFARGSSTGRGDEKRLVPTLAYQLAKYLPDTRFHIAMTVVSDPAIFDLSLRRQVQDLLINPLWIASNAASSSASPRLFIIDGLDECCDADIQCRILQVFTDAIKSVRHQLPHKLLITSRSEMHLLAGFNNTATTYRQLSLDNSYLSG